ncbi:MAG TPA: sugar phosphate isomerase/epimerase family protein [Thermoplasmata archaeon]|nr:sugar phosphate isomerase/epimerase family protein [Thermoplasmata archaeon]
MRIGASTYSREPFPKQIEEAREAGYDYVELDLTWVSWEPPKLREEAEAFIKKIPLETAHFPPSHFRTADLARFAGFMDALAPVGIQVFNVHFLPARSAPTVSADAKTAWLADLAKAAKERGVTVTVENLDEPPQELRRVLDAVPDLRFCLDLGHAHLDKREDGGRTYLEALGDRLGLVHVHDNHGGHGKEGDEHLPFGKGTIDLERDVRALKMRYDGRATLEIFTGTPDDRKACLRKMRRWARP